MTTTATPAVWKTTAGVEKPVTELVTPYLVNCINKVETELTESTVTDRDGKTAILSALKAELATRTDAGTETA